MLPWIIAAASLWRGLTPDEVDQVAAEVLTTLTDQGRDPNSLTASEALTTLDTAIAVVLERCRR
ncbi:hypothetical protein [Microbacterium xylanilyticum]